MSRYLVKKQRKTYSLIFSIVLYSLYPIFMSSLYSFILYILQSTSFPNFISSVYNILLFRSLFPFSAYSLFCYLFSQSVSLTQYVVLCVRLPVCLFQLASGGVLLTILRSNIVGEYRRVFYNSPGTKN